MRRRIVLIGVLCLLAARPAPAQEVLPLDAALADAMRHHPALAASRAALSQADADADLARSALLPHVTFTESWTRGTSPLFAFSSLLGARAFTQADFAVDRLNRPGALTAFGARLSVSQVVFDAGRALAGLSAARRGRDAASARLAQAEADVALAVVTAYGRVLAADATAAATAARIAAAEEDLRRAERRRAAGTATDADVLAVRVLLADARQQASVAAAERAIAGAEVNRLTGAAIDRQFAAAAPPPGLADSEALPVLLAEAARNRPDVAAAAAAVDVSRLQLRQARAGWAPSVAVRAGYDAAGLSFSDRAGAWMAAAELTWSLSLGGAEAARTRSAQAALGAAEAAGRDAQAAVAVDVTAAWHLRESARARVAAGRDAVTAAREARRIVRQRYDNGMATMADVLASEAAEQDAIRADIRAQADALVADAALDRAVGRPVRGSRQPVTNREDPHP